MANEEKDRHPVRLLVTLLSLAGFVYFASKLVMMKKDEFYGLTESEARSKMTERLEKRIGVDKANEIADQVIPVLKDRGVIKSDPVSEAVSDLADTLADAQEDVADAVDDVAGAAEEE